MDRIAEDKTSVLIERLFRPGKKIEIELDDERGNKRTYQTVIIRNINKDHLSLLLSNKEESIRGLKPGAKISINCDELCKFVFITELIEVKSGEYPLLIAQCPTEIHYSSRRRYFRCDVNFPFSFFYKQEQYKGDVLDLSVSGLRATTYSQFNLQQGMFLTCKFVLPTTAKPVLLVAKITRVDKNTEYQEIGLCFQNPSRDIQSQITQFLFQRQRILINQNLKHKAT